MSPKESPAWKRLTRLAASSIKEPLQHLHGDARRFEDFSFQAPGMLVDLSRQRINAETFQALQALAVERDLPAGIEDLIAGAVVNTASVSAFGTRGSSPVYCASKAGLVKLTREWAHALAPEVRVNAIAPGRVESDWMCRFPDQDEVEQQDIRDEIPLQRIGRPVARSLRTSRPPTYPVAPVTRILSSLMACSRACWFRHLSRRRSPIGSRSLLGWAGHRPFQR